MTKKQPAAKPPKKAHGRPSLYTQQLGKAICDRLAKGEPLAQICRDGAIPDYATVRRWESENDEFRALSTRAREIGCHAIADECMEIADNGKNDWMETFSIDEDTTAYKLNGEHIQRSKLRIETRMRLLGKWLPKVYGDKLELSADMTVKKSAADFTDAELLAIATGKNAKS